METPPPSRALSALKHAHHSAVFGRRVRVLAAALGAQIPSGASVLDIGCGDGSIASLIAQHNPSVTLQGIEFAARPTCRIPCTTFDGETIPFPDAAFDVAMFVDVLHHASEIDGPGAKSRDADHRRARSSGITRLLAEAARVSRRYVLIKDHVSESTLDFKTLQFMDWVGNRPHGVVLPYHYQNRKQWEQYFAQTGLAVRNWESQVPLYPFPFSTIFGRKLHFVALLEKQTK
jgi:SAM-dependent methyltransferase